MEGPILPFLPGLSLFLGIVPQCQTLFFFLMRKALLSSQRPPFSQNGFTVPLHQAPPSPPPLSSHRPLREVEGVIVYFSRLFPVRPSLFGVGLGGWGSK